MKGSRASLACAVAAGLIAWAGGTAFAQGAASGGANRDGRLDASGIDSAWAIYTGNNP